jgi:hypothetical protein
MKKTGRASARPFFQVYPRSDERNSGEKAMVSKAKLTLIAAITALGIASPATAESRSYPWCIQGGTYRCWYMTREQCEQAVDYHGFCVANPDMPLHGGE